MAKVPGTFIAKEGELHEDGYKDEDVWLAPTPLLRVLNEMLDEEETLFEEDAEFLESSKNSVLRRLGAAIRLQCEGGDIQNLQDVEEHLDAMIDLGLVTTDLPRVLRSDDEIKAAYEDAWHRRSYVRSTMNGDAPNHNAHKVVPGVADWREGVDDFEWGRVSGIQATLMWLGNENLHWLNPDASVYDQILNTEGHGDT